MEGSRFRAGSVHIITDPDPGGRKTLVPAYNLDKKSHIKKTQNLQTPLRTFATQTFNSNYHAGKNDQNRQLEKSEYMMNFLSRERIAS